MNYHKTSNQLHPGVFVTLAVWIFFRIDVAIGRWNVDHEMISAKKPYINFVRRCFVNANHFGRFVRVVAALASPNQHMRRNAHFCEPIGLRIWTMITFGAHFDVVHFFLAKWLQMFGHLTIATACEWKFEQFPIKFSSNFKQIPMKFSRQKSIEWNKFNVICAN